LTWARKIVAASADVGGAAVQEDGQMVDRPVVLQARRILEQADHESKYHRARLGV
jgi:citrate lyase subunit beta/citryl-CoA lyase